MKIPFIYNSESGTGKIKKYIKWIDEQFVKAGHELILLPTKEPLDATLIASKYHDCKMMLVAGGDGTLNEVVNGLMENDKRPYIGYIPAGTANDVGKLLGMSRRIKKTVKIILKEPLIKAVDISKMNDRYFSYAAATGMFSKASYDLEQSSKKKLRKIAYIIRGSKEAFKKFNIPIKVTHDHGSFEGNYALVIFLNGYRLGGFNLYFLKSTLDNGLISARFFKQNTGVLARIFWFFFTGAYHDTKKNKTIKSSYFKVETVPETEWNTDGEKALNGSIEIKVIPKAISFIIHPKVAKKNFSS